MRENNRVALFSDDPDWHARCLTDALAKRGVEAVWLSFTDCAFDNSSPTSGLRLPGFETELPAGALTRLIDPGTLEQITARLDILHALDELGIVVSNSARAIERTVDKSVASFLLANAGLPSPATWTCESPQMAQAILERQTKDGGKLVLKPLFGAQGKGLRLLEAGSPLPDPEEVDGVYYLQKFIETGTGAEGWHDWRVFVVGGKAVAAMIRRGKGWITNVLQGGVCEAAPLESDLADLAVAAARALGADYAGIDILRDREGGFQILEVNSVPAWKGLQGVVEADLAQTIVDDFLSRIDAASPVRKAG